MLKYNLRDTINRSLKNVYPFRKLKLSKVARFVNNRFLYFNSMYSTAVTNYHNNLNGSVDGQKSFNKKLSRFIRLGSRIGIEGEGTRRHLPTKRLLNRPPLGRRKF